MSTTATTAPAKAALPNEGRPGYKPTKLGWIPEEWEVKRVRELFEIRGRVGWKGYTQADLRDSGPLAIGGKHISEQHQLDLRDPTHLSEEKYVESPEIMVAKGDLLFTQRGTLGRVAHINHQIGPATINPSLVILRPRRDECTEYVHSFLTSSAQRKQMLIEVASTGVPMLSQQQIGDFRIPCPSLVEQRRIAAVLGAWDRAIATAQQLLAAQQERKRGLMQELLTGKRRFPGFGGKWKAVKLGDVVTKAKGSVVTSTNDSTGTPVIDAGSYEGGATLYSTDEQALRCNESDVLLLWDGSKAGRAMTGKKGIVGSTFVLLKPKAELHPVFLTAILTHDEQRIMAVREGSGIPHVPKDFLRWYRFLLPPLKEQEAIIRTIHGMAQLEDSINAQLDLLTTQKRGLMQQLLTGAVRVKH